MNDIVMYLYYLLKKKRNMCQDGRTNNYYRNDTKLSDRQVRVNGADPDQTAPRGAVWSVSRLFAIPSASFERIIVW